MRETSVQPAPLQNAVRWGILLAGLIVVGWHVPKAVREWREWHAAAGFDPSAADAWRTFFIVDMAGIGIVAGLAVVVFYLLRPRTKRAA